MKNYSYQEAFSRNIGWVTDTEMSVLKTKKVAIAGLGGVGSHYCEVLARMGIQNFCIADFDNFEIHNFNRQAGALINNIDRSKIEVAKERIQQINPNANVETFNEGINKDNINDFLRGVDIYIDGLDFFAYKARILVFNEAAKAGIPSISVAPIGMGTSLIVFDKDSMSFNDYFGLDTAKDDFEVYTRFLVGMSPSLKQRHYIVDPTKTDFVNKKAPSTPMGCYLCAGVAGTMAVKILLGRGGYKTAPTVCHFDAYLGTLRKTTTYWGYKNPLQKLKIWFAKQQTTYKPK